MLLKIKDIALVVNPQDRESFEKLFGDGSHLGIKISYIIQEKPRGLAEGLILAEKFLNGSSVFYLLGDNVVFGHNLPLVLEEAMTEVLGKGGGFLFWLCSARP
jgi:glucose-1-phosphate thymidylyltransferase